MGSVLNRGTKSTPRYYAQYKDLDGRWKMRAVKAPTKEQAKVILRQIELNISHQRVGIAPDLSAEQAAKRNLTVAGLVDDFLKRYSSPNVKDIEKYRREVGYRLRMHLVGPHGEMKAAELDRKTLERLRDDKVAGGLSPESVKLLLAYTSRMYNWALAEGVVDCPNPTKDVDPPREQYDDEGDLDYLSTAEIGKLLKWSLKHQPDEHPFYACAIYTGARFGELAGLRWTDVDFDQRKVNIRRSYRAAPKSGKWRPVPLNPELAPILKRWQARCPVNDENLVFPSPRGKMRNKDNDYGLRDALDGAKCHRIGAHGLRHTFASHFVMAGGSILTLQKYLGHHSVKTTEKYAHLSPDHMASEMERLSFASKKAPRKPKKKPKR